jgi:hypothetical protein
VILVLVSFQVLLLTMPINFVPLPSNFYFQTLNHVHFRRCPGVDDLLLLLMLWSFLGMLSYTHFLANIYLCRENPSILFYLLSQVKFPKSCFTFLLWLIVAYLENICYCYYYSYVSLCFEENKQ